MCDVSVRDTSSDFFRWLSKIMKGFERVTFLVGKGSIGGENRFNVIGKESKGVRNISFCWLQAFGMNALSKRGMDGNSQYIF